MKKKFLVITPVSHINNFKAKINKKFDATFHEEITKEKLIEIIGNFEIVFTNPNMSNVFLSKKEVWGRTTQ